jgi:hypothetical protein
MPNAAGSPFPFWSIERGGIQNISEWSLMLHLFLEMLCSAGGKFSVCSSRLSSTSDEANRYRCTEVVCVFIPSFTLSGTDEFGWEQTSSSLSQDLRKRKPSHDFGFEFKKCAGGWECACMQRCALFLIHATWRLSGCMLESLLRWWLWEWELEWWWVVLWVLLGILKGGSCATFLWGRERCVWIGFVL